jgi:hypothetical protein
MEVPEQAQEPEYDALKKRDITLSGNDPSLPGNFLFDGSDPPQRA